MPFYLPNGMIVVNEIQRVVREQLERRGYDEIRTPHVLDVELWKRSGHWDNYRENMFFTQSGRARTAREFALKPMNCPGACLVYASERHSYRELPLRLAEFGLCTRNEREGVLHGLLRVRAFTQDDAHVFCTEEQIVRRGARRSPRRSTSCTRCSASTTCASSCRRGPRSRSAPTSSGRRRSARSRRRSTRWGASTR